MAVTEWSVVLLSGDVEEERDLVGGLVPADVALERVLESVVAHVDGVHDGVYEGQIAELAHVIAHQADTSYVLLNRIVHRSDWNRIVLVWQFGL